jgi:hypothetical protein
LTETERDRQRDNFRRRLEPQPKGPERTNIIIRVLNSPFVLWLMSAMLLTVGGAYFTGSQKCEADAGRLITSYYKQQIELMRRLEYISAGVARAKSIEDIRRVIETQPFVYDDLKTRTTRDLNYEVLRTERLIDFTKDARFIDNVKQRRAADGPGFRFSPHDLLRYGGLPVGEWPFDLNEDDLDAAKHFVEVFTYYEITGLIAHNLVRLWPRCGFVNSVFGVPVRGPRKVVEADTSTSSGR